MKPEGAFIAERAAAQHCAQLLRVPARPADDRPALARLASRLARAFDLLLGPMLGAGDATFVAGQINQSDPAALMLGTPPLAANSLLAIGTDGAPLLASIDAGAVLRMVDRAYGGRGVAPSPLPDAFPLSAQLLISRLEGLVVRAIAEAAAIDPSMVQPVRRDASLSQLAPFADDTPLTILSVRINDGQEPWDIVLAFPAAATPALIGVAEPQRTTPAGSPASPEDAPFADLPLTVRAVLVDMAMGFSALARLEVGQILPVAVARSVPLIVGDRTIAHGTVGGLDDRVAIQITKAFS